MHLRKWEVEYMNFMLKLWWDASRNTCKVVIKGCQYTYNVGYICVPKLL